MTDPTRRLVGELVELRKTRGTRSLEVQTDDLTTTLVVVDGEIVGVSASKPGEPLGRILVRQLLLTQDQYIDVLERMSAALAIGEKVRFGEVAVRLGYVQKDDVGQCLAEQQRILASRVFHGASPAWTTSDLPADRDASRDVTMPVEALFLDAVRWLGDARKNAIALDGARPLALRPSWDLEQIDARLDLTSDEAEFARIALAGDKTVDALLDDTTTPDSVDAHAILTTLIATGAAAACAPGKATRHGTSLHAGPRRSSRPVPGWASVDEENAKNALAKIVLANLTLPHLPSADAAFRSLEDQLRSEQAFQRGKELLRGGRSSAAVTELERALELKPGSTEYELFATWARLAATVEVLDDAAKSELTHQATTALRDNPSLAFGHFVLGEVLRAAGDADESRRQFRHALRLEPTFFAAAHMKRFGEARVSRSSLEGVSASATVAAAPAIDVALAGEPAATSEEPTKSEATPEATLLTPPVGAGSPRRRPRLLLAGLVGVAAIAAASVAVIEHPAGGGAVAVPTGASTAAASTAPVAATMAATATASTAPRAADADAAATDAATSEAGAPEAAPSEADAIAADKGVIVLRDSPVHHRVFVDGRLAATSGTRVTVPCGRHAVRIGSHTKSVSVEVPCAGAIQLP